MEIVKYIANTVELLIFVYLAINICYFLIFAVASAFQQKKIPLLTDKNRKIAVLVPGYREDSVILETARAAIAQNYPKDKFDVIIIADSYSDQTLAELNQLQVIVFPVELGKGRTKAKALNLTMSQLTSGYEIALVLDADNVIEPDFLKKVNNEFNNGFQIVQGHRVAKNINNNMAILDAISEEVNNKLYRKGHRILGLPSGLIGSGMAFDYVLFKSIMKDINAVGGFDKELELKLTQMKYQIAYIEDAYVYDEKVHQSKEFENQRRRWLSAQFVYLRKFFKPAVKSLITDRNTYFLDKLLQMALLPRILLLGIITFIFLFYIIILLAGWSSAISFLLVGWLGWTLLFTGVVLIFIFTIPAKFYNTRTLSALFSLPKTFFIMFLLLFKLKGANQKFIHTQHGVSNKTK
jgi:cellulose synthase/poly-beta-1,6-N-acetylglucosamine synthase-like glycosyltransferase